MAKFLNTKQHSEWISRIIDEAERELILLVPYIKLSEKLLKALRYANSRGVETLLIYRESKLSPKEREKLLSISNLNLMHHPNLHAKCYMNENYLIIGSMNLYEYSELNNREMGVLFSRISIEPQKENNNKGLWIDIADSEYIFQDAINEIKLIVNSAQMERPSEETVKEGFEFDIIKTPKEWCYEDCKALNEYFVTKKFHVEFVDNEYIIKCSNFFDKVDLIHISKGFRFVLNHYQEKSEQILDYLLSNYDEDGISDFKFFVSPKYSSINLYRLYNSEFWQEENEQSEILNKYKQGIDEVIRRIKEAS